MISIITSVTNEKNLDRLKTSYFNVEKDMQLGLNWLCLVNNEGLYLECRNFFDSSDKENLVVYSRKENLNKESIQYLTWANPYTYIANENVIIPSGGLTKLYKDFLEKPTAGLITGEFIEFPISYWVKDIYGDAEYINPSSVDGNNFEMLMDIDTTSIYGIMTPTNLFKEYFGMGDLENYGNRSYGIRLRRQGYKNYLDTSVKFRYGGKK